MLPLALRQVRASCSCRQCAAVAFARAPLTSDIPSLSILACPLAAALATVSVRYNQPLSADGLNSSLAPEKGSQMSREPRDGRCNAVSIAAAGICVSNGEWSAVREACVFSAAWLASPSAGLWSGDFADRYTYAYAPPMSAVYPPPLLSQVASRQSLSAEFANLFGVVQTRPPATQAPCLRVAYGSPRGQTLRCDGKTLPLAAYPAAYCCCCCCCQSCPLLVLL